jgi:hypothetical protein
MKKVKVIAKHYRLGEEDRAIEYELYGLEVCPGLVMAHDLQSIPNEGRMEPSRTFGVYHASSGTLLQPLGSRLIRDKALSWGKALAALDVDYTLGLGGISLQIVEEWKRWKGTEQRYEIRKQPVMVKREG